VAYLPNEISSSARPLFFPPLLFFFRVKERLCSVLLVFSLKSFASTAPPVFRGQGAIHSFGVSKFPSSEKEPAAFGVLETYFFSCSPESLFRQNQERFDRPKSACPLPLSSFLFSISGRRLPEGLQLFLTPIPLLCFEFPRYSFHPLAPDPFLVTSLSTSMLSATLFPGADAFRCLQPIALTFVIKNTSSPLHLPSCHS